MAKKRNGRLPQVSPGRAAVTAIVFHRGGAVGAGGPIALHDVFHTLVPMAFPTTEAMSVYVAFQGLREQAALQLRVLDSCGEQLHLFAINFSEPPQGIAAASFDFLGLRIDGPGRLRFQVLDRGRVIAERHLPVLPGDRAPQVGHRPVTLDR